jgi:hypothetical protein
MKMRKTTMLNVVRSKNKKKKKKKSPITVQVIGARYHLVVPSAPKAREPIPLPRSVCRKLMHQVCAEARRVVDQ